MKNKIGMAKKNGFTAQQKKEFVDIIGTTMSPYFTKVYEEFDKVRKEFDVKLDSKMGQVRKEMIEQKEELKSYIAVQVESLRYEFKATTETVQLHWDKINDHEKRITRLEK